MSKGDGTGLVTYLFIKLYKCWFEVFLDVWTEVVLVDGLTEALALFCFLSHECANGWSGQAVERHRLVFGVSDLF